MSTEYRKRRRSWNEPGHGHFLTYSCFRRLPLLNADRTRRWVIDAMAALRQNQNVALFAYVIMPEHVHVLLMPNESSYDIAIILAALKAPVARRAKQHLMDSDQLDWLEKLTVRYPSREVFRFWQPGGGFDKNIREQRSLRSIIDYIHANPVRRGLVKSALDWKWSSAQFWEGHIDVPIKMDDPIE